MLANDGYFVSIYPPTVSHSYQLVLEFRVIQSLQNSFIQHLFFINNETRDESGEVEGQRDDV